MTHAFLSDPVLVLFGVIALGHLLGRLKVAGLSLGSSGVIFVALAAGYLGGQIPDVGNLGLVLFVYCVGITAGPTFFRELGSKGAKLAQLALVLVATGSLAAWVMARLFGLPADLTAGMFAGALTSTPALAAALEALPKGSQAPVAYGVAYLFGVIGVVLFVQLLPRILGRDLEQLGQQLRDEEHAGRKIVRVLVEVANPALEGKPIKDVTLISDSNCQVPRVLVGNRQVPRSAEFTLELGQHVLLVGREFRVPRVIELLGRRSSRTDYIMDTETERMQVIVTSKETIDRSLMELRALSRFGVTVSRITRQDLEFVPKLTDKIQHGDALNVVGPPDCLEKFAEFAGHRARTFDETDVISLGFGIVAGILAGSISFELNGSGLSLGMAGGPLLVGLLLGHFGRIGPITGRLPRASRLLLTEVGLAFFLAHAGLQSGSKLGPVLKEYCEAFDMDYDEVVSVPFTKLVPISHRPYGKLYTYM